MDAKTYLKENPRCDVIHSTSDGNLFYVHCDAVNHAKTLEDKTVVTERQQPKTESNKPVVASNKTVDKKNAEAEKSAEAAKAAEAEKAAEAANATGENATPADNVNEDATNTNVPAIAAVNKPTAAAKKGANKKASTK
ncbi:hypothetical protein ACFOWM_06255 [Ferruginibacter yonginensis]|uniref:Uncharacterized protein n=1 Tax=Ferruginibacter yonginensis TaxID=1310416 RepID=A0ABV8QU83_9BACT